MPSTTTILLSIIVGMVLPSVPGANYLASFTSPGNAKRSEQSRRPGFAGDAACEACHREESQTFAHTAHHLTSQLPSAGSILGSFENGSNVLEISRPPLYSDGLGISYRMEKKQTGWYVTAETTSGGLTTTRSERIAIVIGSGVRGQSYLYWRNDELYELPVSYWSEGSRWINSPGFGNGPPVFDRPASPRCLECHVTYLEPLSPDPADNRYDRASLVTGISCEVCHGPGATHAARRRSSAHGQSSTEEILNPARFSRDRQVDMCALCHNGAQQTRMGTAFSYTPGQPLDEYLGPNPADATPRPDVHANQVGLLKRSRCYLSSPSMSCSTCHDVHAPERDAASYSTRCLRCHRVESCGKEKTMGAKIADNCIDCHMPVLQTNAIVSETAETTIRTRMRTHWIKIYSQADEN